MRYFGGMSEEEIGDYLKISSRTVKRDWAMTTRLSRQARSACRRRCRGQRGRYTHITRFMIHLDKE